MEPIESSTTAARPDLALIVSDVLGDLAFLVGDDESPDVPKDAAWLECRISYQGPFNGTLRCWCTRNFALQLAANLLGLSLEDDEANEGMGDAVCEFMNVVCGQFVTAWYGTDPVFNLSIPSVVECPAAPRLDLGANAGVCALSVSGEPFYCVYEQN